MAEYKLSYTASEIDERLGMVDNMVKSVNGVTPDESGNVEIAVSGQSPDQVILKSPDGTEWVVIVSDDGILSAVTKADQYDIFVIGGQSNVVGYGTPMLATDVFPDGTYQYTQDGIVEELKTYPLDHIEAYADQIGFQHTFLDAYIANGNLANGRKILLIPCGHPGTSFVSGRWAEGGDLHTAMMNRISAVKNLVGCNGVFKAVLWHQGESDVVEGNNPATYKQQLETLIENTLAITGNIPFIMGEWQQDWLATQGDKGVQMQAVLSDIAEEKEKCYLVSADGLSGDDVNGTIHFSAEAQREFGERYYSVYQTAVNGGSGGSGSEGDSGDNTEPDNTGIAVYDILRLDARTGINGDIWTDESGNNYNATLYNFDSSATSGLNDGTLVFDGTNDYVQFPAEAFDFGSDDFTLQVIGKMNVIDDMVMLSQSNADHSDTTIQIFATHQFCYHVHFTDDTKIDRTTPANTTTNSLAIVRSGDTITLYLNDNAFYTENIGTKAVKSSTTPVTLGKWGEATDNAMSMRGSIRFVGVTKKALTAEQLFAVASEFIA